MNARHDAHAVPTDRGTHRWAGTARARYAVAISAAAVVAGSVIGATETAGADPSGSASRAAGCSGAWRVAIAEGPETLPALANFSTDHTAVFGETSAIDSLTPGLAVEYPSPGIGAWTSLHRNSCSYHFVVLAADSSGTLTRTSDIRGVVHITGSRFRGPVTIRVTHPHGAGTTIHTVASGNRIRP